MRINAKRTDSCDIISDIWPEHHGKKLVCVNYVDFKKDSIGHCWEQFLYNPKTDTFLRVYPYWAYSGGKVEFLEVYPLEIKYLRKAMKAEKIYNIISRVKKFFNNIKNHIIYYIPAKISKKISSTKYFLYNVCYKKYILKDSMYWF